MRREMIKDESALKEEMIKKEKVHQRIGDQLLEKWSKTPNLGEGLDKIYSENKRNARNTAIVLENQEQYMKKLTEQQISNDFSTIPQNVLKVIRLGYPNSVRGELFNEFAMTTARDSIYYVKPTYMETARGATADAVTFESAAYRYSSEEEQEVPVGAINGSNATYTGNSSTKVVKPPIRPFTVKIILNNAIIAVDNGIGGFVGAAVSTGTISYTDGDIDFVLASAPASGSTLVYSYCLDSEVVANYDEVKTVKLLLTDHQFRARPFPLYITWDKMVELLLGTTLDIDAEEELMRAAGDEFKKSFDFDAVRLGYQTARANGNTVTTFNADFAAAGADSAKDHAQSFTRSVAQASKYIYNQLQRGGVSHVVVGTDLAAYLTLHDRFTEEGQQPAIGVYRVGTLLGKPVYQAPNSIIPANEGMGIWRNESELSDVSIAFGTLVPMYATQRLEYKNAYSEQGLYSFQDRAVLQNKYLVRFDVSGLDA